MIFILFQAHPKKFKEMPISDIVWKELSALNVTERMGSCCPSGGTVQRGARLHSELGSDCLSAAL